MTGTPRPCAVEGCERTNIAAKGLCRLHYLRQWRGRGLGPSGPLAKPDNRKVEPIDLVAERVAYDGSCLIWIGTKTSHGYGIISLGGKRVMAHRLHWETVVGSIPEGAVLDHHCQPIPNPSCVMVSHLRPVTQKQNVEHKTVLPRHNQSGYLGVYFDNQRNRWVASVEHLGKRIRRAFRTPEEAATEAVRLRNLVFTHNDRDRSEG